jgi:hypothetical protein
LREDCPVHRLREDCPVHRLRESSLNLCMCDDTRCCIIEY